MASKTNQRPVLKVRKRKVLGRKVKSLRKKGILPANIYGRHIKSVAVEGDLAKIKKVFSQVGETGLVDLWVEKEKKARPVLLHNPQYNPLNDELVHLDFYQVDLSEKVTSDIPIEISGEAPAVAKGEGILVQLLNEIEVEALPTDLPEKFVVDVSQLEKVDEGITVAQLVKASKLDPQKITVKASDDQLVVKIEPPTKEEEPVTEEAPAEEGEAAAEKEAPAEAEKPAAEAEEEKKEKQEESKEASDQPQK